MTNYEELKTRYVDELNDVITYVNLSKNASDETEKQVFKDIAKEEYEHAHMIKHVLKNTGHFIDDLTTHELKERAKKELSDV